MHAIDWKKGPGFKTIETIKLPTYHTSYLDNGTKFITVNQGTQDIIKLDLILKGGRFLETKQLTANFTTAMLREGTASYDSKTIANTVDFYGAVLRTMTNLDYIHISLTLLSKHFEALCPLLAEIIYQPIFDEEELRKHKNNAVEKLSQDIAKNDTVSYRELTAGIFGIEHPYGYNTTKEAIEALEAEDLKTYFKNNFGSTSSFIVLSGKFSKHHESLVNKFFGQHSKEVKLPMYEPLTFYPKDTRLASTKNDVQASFKIGRRLFDRHHPDYAGFYVLNTIFGGYFGSRLMTKIREELGYTYSIYSALDYLMYDGYFYITSEVSNENLQSTLSEVHNQMEKLTKRIVTTGELQMVKNYLMGNMLNLIDGPLNSSSLIKSLELDNCLEGTFYEFLNQIQTVTAQDIKKLAQKYFDPEKLLTVIVQP